MSLILSSPPRVLLALVFPVRHGQILTMPHRKNQRIWNGPWGNSGNVCARQELGTVTHSRWLLADSCHWVSSPDPPPPPSPHHNLSRTLWSANLLIFSKITTKVGSVIAIIMKKYSTPSWFYVINCVGLWRAKRHGLYTVATDSDWSLTLLTL